MTESSIEFCQRREDFMWSVQDESIVDDEISTAMYCGAPPAMEEDARTLIVIVSLSLIK